MSDLKQRKERHADGSVQCGWISIDIRYFLFYHSLGFVTCDVLSSSVNKQTWPGY